MKPRVTAVIESLVNGVVPEAEALAALQEITGRPVDPDWLRHYGASESLEDLVDRLCAVPIEDWEQITEIAALGLIGEYLETASPGRRDSIELALDRRFGKPSGTLSDLVYQIGFQSQSRFSAD